MIKQLTKLPKINNLDAALATATLLGFNYIAADSDKFNQRICAYIHEPLIKNQEWIPTMQQGATSQKGKTWIEIGIYTGDTQWNRSLRPK